MKKEKKQNSTTERVLETKNKTKKGNQANDEILFMLYLFVGLFVLCIGYFTWFIAKDSRNVINNSYNKRASLLAETILRGEILSKDHERLAFSLEQEDGTVTRVYPYGNMFAHVVGRFDRTKTGIEASEDFTMLTSSISMFETFYNQLSDTRSKGNNIVTTLDVGLQKVAYEALGNRKGAVVVLEPSTGKVLALVSKPDYDPNTVASTWDDLIQDANSESALLNRATQGLYPPGSTFKIVTLLSYLRQNNRYEEYEYDCLGEAEFGESIIHCYNNKRHGHETLSEAFAHSCNTAFANIGTMLNLRDYQATCNQLLFNASLPFDLPYKKSSFVLNESSSEMEITQTAIGQGKTLMTPMHNAMLVAAIANGGNLMTPYVVDQVESYHGIVIEKNTPKMYKSLMTSQEAELLTEYMTKVVQSGTAQALKNNSYSVAGKTGSAEVGVNETAHAWFVGFAPTDQPKIAVSIIVENAGAGSEYAVPIAKKIMDAYNSMYGMNSSVESQETSDVN